MTSSQRESFGPLVRREREAREIALRQMAKTIGVSPTYLSKIERGTFPPPSEDKVKAIAKIIGHDADELLALAGRVASDLTEIIRRRPREIATLLRTVEGLTAEDMTQVAREAQQKARHKRRRRPGTNSSRRPGR
ncbi:MAG: helix-turn-helix domain-containing protein [Beggiatoa sp.]|nr:helix-turn-helix domain-containing protein [Beggiatoa sp.]